MVQKADAKSDAKSVEGERPQAVRPRKVTVCGRIGPNVIVKDGGRYALLPKNVVVDGKALADDLAAAPDYGVAWEKLLPSKGGAELAAVLRARGIWTIDDLNANWPLAKRLRVGVCDVDMADVLKQAEEKKE